jgi:hypothetical protein
VADHSRGDLSLADVLDAARRLGATDLGLISEIIFASPAPGLVAPAPQPVVSTPTERPLPPSPPLDPLPPSARASGERAVGGAPVAMTWDETTAAAVRPDWLDAVGPLPPASTRGRPVPSAPPVAPVRARAAFGTIVRRDTRGRRIDLDRLISRAARGRPWTPLPFLIEPRVAPFVQVLCDIGENMEPYLDDVTFLARRLREVAGLDRSESRTFVGTPLRGTDVDPFTDEAVAWEPPPSGSVVVLVTDLGLNGPSDPWSRADPTVTEWRRFASELDDAEVLAVVLTPYAADRWPARPPLPMISWRSLDE